MKYEEKNYDLTLQAMKKIGELGLLGVSLEEKYGGMGMDFTSTMLAVDYVSGTSGLLQQHMVLIQVLQYYLFIYLVMKIKSKNTYLNLLQENGLARIV